MNSLTLPASMPLSMPTVPLSTGQLALDSIVDDVERDMAAAVNRRSMKRAHDRFLAIRADFANVIDGAIGKSEIEQHIAAEYVRGCRNELEDSFRLLNPNGDQTTAERLVNQFIEEAIARLKPVAPASREVVEPKKGKK